MNILIVYGTTEGQTQKIAEFAANRIRELHHDVQLLNCEDRDIAIDTDKVDAVLAAASVHHWQHQTSMVDFMIEHRHWIADKPNAFISVSLSEVFEDDRAEAHLYIDQFADETGWRPKLTLSLAGALRYKEYDFLRLWALRFMASMKGAPTDVQHDHEYTDWDQLKTFVEDFVTIAAEQAPATA